jgi:hypothetical protein
MLVATYIFAATFTVATAAFLLTLVTPFKVKFERITRSAEKRKAAVIAAAGTGAVAVTCFGLLLSGTVTPASPGQPAPSRTPGASPSLTASAIAFDEPRNGDQIKQCPKIEGTGIIPAGKGLWIVVVANSAERPKQYWLVSPAEMDGPDHWSTAHAASVGDPGMQGEKSEIYAVLIEKTWSDFFTKSNVAGAFSAQGLPPTADVIAGPVEVSRVADPHSQSCH